MKKTIFKATPLTWILIIVMMLSVLPTTAFASTGEYDETDAVSFVFSDSGITTSDTTHTSSYKIEDTALSIKASGTYILSGSCADGNVTVKKGTTGVTLVLNGLSLTNTGSETSAMAPLICNKSTGVTIVVAEGTTNTLKDSVYNNDETYTTNEDAENAVIKCKDGSQVTITGAGTLNIISNGKNGIKSGTTDSETNVDNPRDAFLTIKNVTLNITANANDAINAEQELNILSGTLNITAVDDAIHSDYNLTIGSAGTTGPTINITKAYEGIEGATINICSGNIKILSTDDCINAANADLEDYNFSITISGGTLYGYTTTGDGFDSNGSLTISGGTVEIWSANNADNQPLDADGKITISSGTVFTAGGSNGMGSKLNATQTYITFGNSGSQQTGNQQPGTQGRQQFGTQGRQQGTQGMQQQGTQGTSITSGTTVSVKNSSGTVLYTTTAPCNASYVLFSSSKLNSSENYTLTTGNGSSSSEGEGSEGEGGEGNINEGPTAGFAKYNGTWYYYENGKISTKTGYFTDVDRYKSTGIIYRYYVVNGKIDFSYTAMAETNNARYYKNGRWMRYTTGAVKVGDDYYYVENGTLKTSFEGLLKVDGIWRYFRYGKWQKTISGFVTDKSRTNQVYRYRVKNGIIDWTFSGLGETNNGRYYKNGRWMCYFTGTVKIAGKNVRIKNGYVKT